MHTSKQTIFGGAVALFVLAILPCCAVAADEEKSLPPLPTLPKEHVTLTTREYRHGDARIVVNNAKGHPEAYARTNPFICAAWMSVFDSDGREPFRFVCPNIDPSGAPYGAFVPKEQPSREFFAVIFLDGYDGYIVLVDRRGNATRMCGNTYFLTKDKRHLVTVLISDWDVAGIFDMVSGTSPSEKLAGGSHGVSVYHQFKVNMGQWYHLESVGYFFTTYHRRQGTQDPVESRDTAYVLDLETGSLSARSISEDQLKEAEKITYTFHGAHPGAKDCTCEAE